MAAPPRSTLRRIALCAGAVSLLSIASGCRQFQEPAFNQGQGAMEVPILLVPFQESHRRLWYGESSRGEELIRSLKTWAQENADGVRIVEGTDVQEALRAVRDWTQEEITGKDWADRIARGLGVKYVVEGDLGPAQLRNSQVIGVYKGSCKATFRVIDAETGRLAYEATVEGVYDGDRDTVLLDRPSGELDEMVERNLLQRVSIEIGKKLYGFEVKPWDEEFGV